MKESLDLKTIINVAPPIIYNAWLDSHLHSGMTGGEAKINTKVGSTFTAWNGYITGTNIELIPNQKIIQNWRTSEFNPNDESSILTIVLKEIENGTELTLIHKNIPEGQTQYKNGWVENYFDPMKNYFENSNAINRS